MTLLAVVNEGDAPDVCTDLGEINFVVIPGAEMRKGKGKKQIQLVITALTEMEEAKAEEIIKSYGGRILDSNF